MFHALFLKGHFTQITKQIFTDFTYYKMVLLAQVLRGSFEISASTLTQWTWMSCVYGTAQTKAVVPLKTLTLRFVDSPEQPVHCFWKCSLVLNVLQFFHAVCTTSENCIYLHSIEIESHIWKPWQISPHVAAWVDTSTHNRGFRLFSTFYEPALELKLM